MYNLKLYLMLVFCFDINVCNNVKGKIIKIYFKCIEII